MISEMPLGNKSGYLTNTGGIERVNVQYFLLLFNLVII